MSVLLITERDSVSPTESRFREKVFRTARINLEDWAWTSWEGGRAALWEEMRSRGPRVIVAEGYAVAKALLQGKSNFKLTPILHSLQSVGYTDALVVPIARFDHTRRQGRAAIAALVQTLIRIRNFVRED